MSNDYGSVDTEYNTQDEEVNCVFCGKLFLSVEHVQEHIVEIHESGESHANNAEPVLDNKQAMVLDLNSEVVSNKDLTDYKTVVHCPKCDLLFLSVSASQTHYEREHLSKKRRRSSNPNGVEGIIVAVNGSDNWGCDVCSRQFPTLKQAKVHKFKSHIEPLQKNELMIHTNIFQNYNILPNNCGNGLLAENKFREILPNSRKLKIDKSEAEGYQTRGNGDVDSGGGGGGGRSSQDDPRGCLSAGGDIGRSATGNLWRAAQASSRGNKIVISRVYQSETLIPGTARTKYGFLQKGGHHCCYCKEIFINKGSFTRHLLLHRADQCYKCTNCGSKFKRIKSLWQHQRLNCHIEILDMTGALDLHKKPTIDGDAHLTPQKPVERKVFSVSNADNQVAKKSVAIDKEDQISPRDIKFAEKFLNNSSITLNKGSQCVCNLCQSCFYSNSSILRHMVLYHRIVAQDGSTALTATLAPRMRVPPQSDPVNQNSKPSLTFIHDCDLCGSQFASNKGLQRHLQAVHAMTASSGADGLLEGDSQALEAHKEQCSPLPSATEGHGRPPFLPGRHRDRGRLIAPSSKKAKVPPNADGLFECDVCHKTFACRSSLSNHVKSHFNFLNKPFSCSACQQGFMSTLTLQHHRERLCPGIFGIRDFHLQPIQPAAIFPGAEVSSPSPPSQTGLAPSNGNGVGMNPSYGGPAPSNDGPAPSNGATGSNLTTRATSCMHCSAMFPDRSLLEDHASKEHSNQAGEVVCITCPRSFTTYMAFRVHMTKSHGGPNGTSLKGHLQLAGPLMKVPATEEAGLVIHKTVSALGGLEGPPPRFACPHCDRTFGTSHALSHHKRACMPHLYKKIGL